MRNCARREDLTLGFSELVKDVLSGRVGLFISSDIRDLIGGFASESRQADLGGRLNTGREETVRCAFILTGYPLKRLCWLFEVLKLWIFEH